MHVGDNLQQGLSPWRLAAQMIARVVPVSSARDSHLGSQSLRGRSQRAEGRDDPAITSGRDGLFRSAWLLFLAAAGGKLRSAG